MNTNLNQNPLLAKIVPFIGMGIFLVVIVIAVILFSYVLIIGGIIGLVLFCIAYLKQKFFPSKSMEVSTMESRKDTHHVYDNDEFK